MTKQAKQMLIWTGATMLCCLPLRAGEQVQIRGSTSIELPKPKRDLSDKNKVKSGDDKPAVDGGFAAPPIDGAAMSDKPLKDALDKKRNWIFMDPYENHYDSKTEKFLEGEKGTGLYENRWMKSKEDKSLVQKFIEGKDSRLKDSRGKDGRAKDADKKESEEASERSSA